jgi:hypothetical protein
MTPTFQFRPGRNPRVLGLALTILLGSMALAFDLNSAVQQKFDQIASDRLRAGTRVAFSLAELNAYALHEVPPGVRNPKIQLLPNGEVTGSALVDFGKVRRAQGEPPGWLMSKLLDGERPVSATVRIHSKAGTARVDVLKVDISSMEIDGKVLDFLVQNILLPLYPSAMVARDFQLSHRMDHLELTPTNVTVVIGR